MIYIRRSNLGHDQLNPCENAIMGGDIGYI